jgi:outer membrane receptor protein involved in Fe transport
MLARKTSLFDLFKKRTEKPSQIILPFLLLSSLFINPALAETEVFELEAITVTGEKTDRTLQETVSSVSVTTDEEIEDGKMLSINSAIERAVNVTSTTGGKGFSIRGINSGNIAGGNTTSSGLASMYIDNAFIPRFGMAVGQKQLWDIEQVEIFRGPQSTVQGRNALAGAVIIKSKDPTFETSVDARLLAGEYGTSGASIALSGPLKKDVLAARIAIDYQKSDGYITNPTLNDDTFGGSENSLIRGKLLFNPKTQKEFSALLTLSRSENKGTNELIATKDSSGAAISPYERISFSNIESILNDDQDIASLDLNYQLSPTLRLQSVTTYNRNEYQRQADDDRSAIGGDNKRLQDNETSTASQEIRLHFNKNRWKGLVGIHHFDQDQYDTSNFIGTLDLENAGVPAPLRPFYTDTDPFPLSRDATFDVGVKSSALFGNVEYKVSNRISLFGGLRYDKEKQNYKNRQQLKLLAALPDPTTLGPLPPAAVAGINAVNAAFIDRTQPIDIASNASFSALLPKLGVTYNVNKNTSTSFAVQRGYRAGGADLVFGDNNKFDPEYTTNYEISLRSSMMNNRLTLNSNVFYTDWEDQQVAIEQAPLLFHTKNAGKSKLYGLEVGLNAKLNNGLDLFANLGHVKTKFIDFKTNGNDYSGNNFPNAPKWTASIGATKRFDKGLILSADANYQSSSFFDPPNKTKLDSRTIVNASLGYEFKNVDVSLFARNIFDEEYTTTIFELADSVKVGEPRTVGLQLTGHW